MAAVSFPQGSFVEFQLACHRAAMQGGGSLYQIFEAALSPYVGSLSSAHTLEEWYDLAKAAAVPPRLMKLNGSYADFRRSVTSSDPAKVESELEDVYRKIFAHPKFRDISVSIESDLKELVAYYAEAILRFPDLCKEKDLGKRFLSGEFVGRPNHVVRHLCLQMSQGALPLHSHLAAIHAHPEAETAYDAAVTVVFGLNNSAVIETGKEPFIKPGPQLSRLRFILLAYYSTWECFGVKCDGEPLPS